MTKTPPAASLMAALVLGGLDPSRAIGRAYKRVTRDDDLRAKGFMSRWDGVEPPTDSRQMVKHGTALSRPERRRDLREGRHAATGSRAVPAAVKGEGFDESVPPLVNTTLVGA